MEARHPLDQPKSPSYLSTTQNPSPSSTSLDDELSFPDSPTITYQNPTSPPQLSLPHPTKPNPPTQHQPTLPQPHLTIPHDLPHFPTIKPRHQISPPPSNQTKILPSLQTTNHNSPFPTINVKQKNTRDLQTTHTSAKFACPSPTKTSPSRATLDDSIAPQISRASTTTKPPHRAIVRSGLGRVP